MISKLHIWSNICLSIVLLVLVVTPQLSKNNWYTKNAVSRSLMSIRKTLVMTEKKISILSSELRYKGTAAQASKDCPRWGKWKFFRTRLYMNLYSILSLTVSIRPLRFHSAPKMEKKHNKLINGCCILIVDYTLKKEIWKWFMDKQSSQIIALSLITLEHNVRRIVVKVAQMSLNVVGS